MATIPETARSSPPPEPRAARHPGSLSVPDGDGLSAEDALADLESCQRTLVSLATKIAAAGGWAATERERAISSLDVLVQEASVLRGKVLLEHREQGQWGNVTDRDFVAWRARTTGAGRGIASGEMGLAQVMTELPEVAKVVDEGNVNLEHAKALSRVWQRSSPRVKQALADGEIASLLTSATRLSAPELAQRAKRRAAAIDAAQAQADHQAVASRRSLRCMRSAGGRSGEFFLTEADGVLVETALDAIAGRPAQGDDRTRQQRLADALVTMAGRVLQVGDDRNGAQVRPHLALVVREETWLAMSRHRRELAAALATGGSLPLLPDVPPAELEDGQAVAPSQLMQLMCDCELTRVVMAADSIPLDVGRSKRLYDKALRRAVTTRDRHCRWPHCTLRASWCEVHHIVWFSQGGATSVDNGITLCSYHHHRVHSHHVRITAVPGGHEFRSPHGDLIGTAIRRPWHEIAGSLTPPIAAASLASRGTAAGTESSIRRSGVSPLDAVTDRFDLDALACRSSARLVISEAIPEPAGVEKASAPDLPVTPRNRTPELGVHTTGPLRVSGTAAVVRKRTWSENVGRWSGMADARAPPGWCCPARIPRERCYATAAAVRMCVPGFRAAMNPPRDVSSPS